MAQMKARVVITADGQGVIKESRKILRQMENLGSDIRNAFRSGLADSGSLLTDMSHRAGQLFGTLRNPVVLATTGLIGLGAAAVQAGRAAIDFGTAFDSNMGNVATLLDTTKVDMQLLGQQVIQTAKDFRRSPSLIADALYEWISANGRIDDGLAEFRQSVKASIGGVTDAKVAVDGMTTILNAYGEEAGGAAQVSDLMFQTVNKGKIRFEELASQIGLVISTAKGASVPLNDLMAAIATATAQGVRPSSAMEGLRSAISNIIKPSEGALETAKLLGLEWGVSALKAKGLAGFLKDVREKTKGNVETMAQLFTDVSGLNVVLALTGEGASMFADNLSLMETAGGSTDEAFQKQRDTFKEVVAGLAALGEATLVNIFNKFKPWMTEAGQWVIDNWPRVTAQISQTGTDLANIVNIGLTPFRLAWESSQGAIQVVINLLRGDLNGAASAAQTALTDLAGELSSFKTTWESITVPPWVSTLAGLAVTLGTAAAGIRALTWIISLLAEGFLSLGAAAEILAGGSFLAAIARLFSLGGLGAALGNLWTALQLAGSAIGGVVSAVVGAVAGLLGVSVGAAAAIVAAIVAIVVAGIYAITHWDEVKAKAQEIWAAIPGIVSAGVEAVRTFLTETIPRWMEAFTTWGSETLKSIIQWFTDLPGKILAGIEAFNTWLDEQIAKWGYAFGRWLGDTLVSITSWFMDLGGEIAASVAYAAGWLSVQIPKWVEAFNTWLSDTLSAINKWFTDLPTTILGLITNVGTFLTKTVPEKWTAFWDWLKQLDTELTTWFAGLPDRFVSWLQNAVNAVTGLLDAFKAKGRALAEAIWQGMKDSITGSMDGLAEKARGIVDKVKGAFTQGQKDASGGEIPQFGSGGIVRRAMLAVVGEAGEEAIVPRADAASWLPLIAQWAGLGASAPIPTMAGVATSGGGGGMSIGAITVVVQAPPGTDNPQAWGQRAGDALYDRLANMIKL